MALLLFLTLYYWHLRQHSSDAHAHMQLARELQSLRPKARGGESLAALCAQILKNPGPYSHILALSVEAAEAKGVALGNTLNLLSAQVEKVLTWQTAKQRALDIFCFRSISVTFIGMLAAQALKTPHRWQGIFELSPMAALAGALIAVSGYGLNTQIGRSWIHAQGQFFAAWLKALVSEDEPTKDQQAPFAAELKAYHRAEWQDGISRRKEKTELLYAWAEAQQQHDEQRLERAQEFLAIWELLGTGLALALIYCEPLLAVLDQLIP